MQRLRKFWQLSARDRLLLVNSFILLGLVRFGLWLLPFQKLQQLLNTISQIKPKSPVTETPTIESIVKVVNLSTHYMPGGAKCLARAFTTQVLMSRYGYISQMRIGVTKGEQGQLKAHAWVENQGHIIIGDLSNLSDFKPFPALKISKAEKTFYKIQNSSFFIVNYLDRASNK